MAESNGPPVTDILEPDDQPADDSGVDEVCPHSYVLDPSNLVVGHRQRLVNSIDHVQYTQIPRREWQEICNFWKRG
jgi:hypothetical protein